MTQQKLERLFARILIQHVNGATICYLYNREALDAVLNIERHEYDKSQFIEIGNELTIEDKKYRVAGINFKMEDHLNEMGHGFGINVYSPTDPTDFNCQIVVFVENLD